MKISFDKLHIENFMSIVEIDLDFNSLIGYNIVVGENNMVADNAKSNGSGKSSIFEAIVWCLTGETIRGNKDVVNHNTEDGTEVTLTFNCDGSNYVISRYKEHKKYKNNLLINVNGEDKSGKGIRDSEKILENYLPELTASLIGSVIVLGQGMPSRFTNNAPSSRKEVLEKLTNSDFMIEDIKRRIQNRKTDLNTNLRNIEDEALQLSTKINVFNQRLQSLKNDLNALENVDQMIALREELEQLIKKHRESIVTYSSQYSELDSRIQTIKNQYDELETTMNSSLSSLKDEYNDKRSNIMANIAAAEASSSVLKKKIADAKKITDICPTCGQKLPGVYVPNTQADEEELSTLCSRISQLSIDNDRLREQYLVSLWGEVEAAYKPELSMLSNELISLQAKRNEAINGKATAEDAISNIERRILGIDGNIQLYESKKNSLISEIKSCEEHITHYEASKAGTKIVKTEIEQRLGIITKFETIVKRDFRGYLLQDIIVYINNRAKVYCKTVFDTDLIDFVLDGNNIAISYNGKSYEALSGGERQKVDIIIQFAIRDVLCAYTGFHTNIIVLDEIFDNLDDTGSHKVIDLISRQLTDISAIFIISHHAKELNLPYDRELTIRKDENGVSSLV